MYKDTIEKLTAAGLNPGKTIAETKKETTNERTTKNINMKH